jgi:hypothetical protein
MRRHLLPLVLIALVAAACGKDDSGSGAAGNAKLSSEEQAFAEAIAADLIDPSGGLGVNATEADCMGVAVMAETGVEPFDKAGVTPEELGGSEKTPGQELGEGAITEAQAEAIYAAWDDCADLAKALAASAMQDFESAPDEVACLEEGLRGGTAMHDYIVESFTSEQEPDPTSGGLGDLVTLLSDCTGAEGGALGSAMVDEIASSFSSGGAVTAEQAQCLAQFIVDTVGLQALIDGGAGGDFSNAPPELQQQMVQAVSDAAAACDVPLSQLGG